MALEGRIARLAQCILHGAAAASQMERRLRAPAGEQAAVAGLLAADRRAAGAAPEGLGAPLPAPPPPPAADVAATVGGVCGAGALFPGQALEQASTARWAAGGSRLPRSGELATHQAKAARAWKREGKGHGLSSGRQRSEHAPYGQAGQDVPPGELLPQPFVAGSQRPAALAQSERVPAL